MEINEEDWNIQTIQCCVCRCHALPRNSSSSGELWTSGLQNSHSLMTPSTMLKQQGCRENDQKTGRISTSPLVTLSWLFILCIQSIDFVEHVLSLFLHTTSGGTPCFQSKMLYCKRQTFSSECYTQVNILSETNIVWLSASYQMEYIYIMLQYILLFTATIAPTVSTVNCPVLEFCFEVFKKKEKVFHHFPLIYPTTSCHCHRFKGPIL